MSLIPVMPEKCGTCPFRRGSKYQNLAGGLAESALNDGSRIEPVFILRGKDLLAPQRVKAWIAAAVESDIVPDDKINGAKAHYDAMIKFQNEHRDRCKMPD